MPGLKEALGALRDKAQGVGLLPASGSALDLGLKGAGVYGLATQASDLVGEPLARAYGGVFHGIGRMGAVARGLAQVRGQQIADQMRAEQLEQLMGVNTARLAATMPDVYNQVLAGRTLPRGAVVLGGGQNPDRLQALAMAMSMGSIKGPQSVTDQYSQAFGGAGGQ